MSAISKQYVNLACYMPSVMPLPGYLIDPSIKTLLKLSILDDAVVFVKDGVLFSCRPVDFIYLEQGCTVLTLKEIYSL